MNAEAIFRKLYLDDSKSVLIVNAPEAYTAILKGLGHDTHPAPEKKGSYDFVQVFGTTQEELEKLIVQVADAGKYDCIFWACYPKLTGKIKSNMKRETVWHALSLAGLKAVSSVSIDETWSALRGRPDQTVKGK